VTHPVMFATEDRQADHYMGPTKTGAGRHTIGLNPALVELLPQRKSRREQKCWTRSNRLVLSLAAIHPARDTHEAG
jgi:hypothetical protein